MVMVAIGVMLSVSCNLRRIKRGPESLSHPIKAVQVCLGHGKTSKAYSWSIDVTADSDVKSL